MNLKLKARIAGVQENMGNASYRKAGQFEVLGEKITCLYDMIQEYNW